ncbi:MAG: hypothetical protein KatS3mg115_0771 [Candidatus Poribacteria bacterium]|nr:MAG: hypothetical protein KatS3mg115_0771 [Candidatus Poribacteria bacterium]
MAASRPNILWISLEDVSPRFGCTGDPVARTPNIDRLAAEGVRFPNAFCVAPVCAPSRHAIIVGLYPTYSGAHHMRTTHRNPHTPELPTPYEVVLPPEAKILPEYLRAAGYYCTNNVKTDYQFSPPVTGWDENSREAHWRNRPDPSQPFFAVFNETFTHESGMWPREDRPLETDPTTVSVPPYLPDTPRVRETIARHYDNLARADRFVGELLEQLEEDGLAENTIVFLWSDHGEGLPRAKRWLYDTGIRIPLIVRWPEAHRNGALAPGSTDDRLVSLIDLPPTVLSLCGLDIPAHMQGQPFLGPQAQPRQYVYATRDRYDETYDMVRAVRDRRFKYIRNYRPELPRFLWIPYRNRHPAMQELWRLHAEGRLEGPALELFRYPRPVEELYDCENDPWELNNLANNPAYREVLERMRSALEAWRQRFDRWGEVPEAQMVSLFWNGSSQQPTTAPVVFVPIAPEQPGTDAAPEGGRYTDPTLLQLHCATQGASIAWTTDPGESPRWRLYTEPIRLPVGTTTVRAKAIRIGYRESEERRATFTVQPAG